jgi:tRNA-specific 2-thiouridylase
MDARSVCHKLGLPYYLVDEAEEFQKQIINYFAEEYKAGRTPNPCVMCNEKLKFGTLINRAKQLGADFVATGHYARIEKSPHGTRDLLKRPDARLGPRAIFILVEARPTGALPDATWRTDQE